MKNALQFTPQNADVALRGNTSRVCQHIANGQSRVGLSRREVISKVRAENKRAEMIANARAKFTGSTHRVALVTPRGGSGYHVVGLGFLALSPRELRLKLALRGFTDIRNRVAGKVGAAKAVTV